jgi:head-tail adaptor
MKTQMLNAWVTFGNIHAYVQGQSGRQKKLVEAAGRHHE